MATDNLSSTVRQGYARHRYYEVRAVNKVGGGIASEALVARTATAQGILAVASGPATFNLGEPSSFSVAVTGGSGATSYQWQRRAGTSGAWSDVGTAAAYSFTENTATPDTYQVRCLATRSGFTATSNTLTVTFARPGDALTSLDATIIQPGGTTRYYQVRPVNIVGPGAPSQVRQAVVTALPTVAPPKPTGFTVTPAGAAFRLRATSGDASDGIDKWQYRIATTSGGLSSATWTDIPDSAGSSLDFTTDGVAYNTTRHFAVRAVNEIGAGPASDAASATTGDPLPTSVTANAGRDATAAAGGSTAIGGPDTIANGLGATTIAWTRVSGAGGSLSSTTAASPTFYAPSLAPGADDLAIVWRKTVTNNGVSDSDDVTVTVQAPAVPGVSVTLPAARYFDLPGFRGWINVSGANVPASVLAGSSAAAVINFSLSSDGAVVLGMGTGGRLSTAMEASGTINISGTSTDATPVTVNATLNVADATRSGDGLTYTWATADGGGLFDALDGIGTGNLEGTLTFDDGTNTIVTAEAGPDRTVDSAGTVGIGGTDTVENGSGATTIAWTRVSGAGGSLSSTTAASPTFTAPSLAAGADDRIIVWRKTVTNNGVSSSDVVQITVSAPAALPDAVAPSVAINAVADGDEGTTVALSATVSGGTYDALDYAWTVEGGTLDDATLASPTWTRPAVSADTDYDIDLTVTARGTGSVARTGTPDTATATQIQATVEDVPAPVTAPSTAPSGLSATGTTLSWGAVAGATSYDIYWDSQSGNAPVSGTTADLTSTTTSVTNAAIQTGRSFWVRGRNSAGAGPWSARFNYNATPTVTVGAPTVDDAVPTNGDTVRFTAGAVGGTATGAISYQWQLLSGSSWGDIQGATGATYDRTEAAAGTVTVRVVVTRGGVTATSGQIAATWSAAAAAAALQDAAGNRVASFAAQTVTNNVPTPVRIAGVASYDAGGSAALTVGSPAAVRVAGIASYDAGGAATLTVTAPAAAALQDAAGNRVASFAAQTVTNNVPTPVRIAGVASYDAGGSAALTVGSPAAVRVAGIASYDAGGAATLTVTAPAAAALQDAAGNRVASFAAQTVTNRVGPAVPDVRIAGIATYLAGGSAALTVAAPADTTAPSLESAATNADGTAVTLTFDEALDSTAAPAASAFALTVDGTAASLQSVAISGATVTLNLAASVTIEHGDAVTVAYTAPAQNPLQDAVGNDVASFTAQTVTNSVPRPSTLPWTLDLPHATGSPAAITRTWNASIPSDRTASGLANAALQVTVTYLENFLAVVEIEIGTGTGAGFQGGATGQDLTVELEEARLFLQNADGSVTLWEGILGEVDSSQSEPYDLDATEDETLAIHGQTGALRLLFEEPNIRIAGIASYEAGGSAQLTVDEVPDVRIAGIATFDAGGSAALTVTAPPEVRIAGIATYQAGGAASLTIDEPSQVRIAGIATYNAGGAATLTVDPLGRLFPHEGTLTKSGSWWNEETGTIPAALTSASSGDQALNVRVRGDEGDRSLRIRLSGGTTVAFASAVLDAARLALWDASSADPDEFLIDVRLSGDTSSPYDIPISEARYDAINGAGNTLFYRLHLQPGDIRVEGIPTYNAGGSAALTIGEVPDVRIAGIATYLAGGSATLTVGEVPDVRIAGIATYLAGGSATLTVGEVPDVRIAGIATYNAGGAAALTVTEPDAVRIAGIATYLAGGSATLTIDELVQQIVRIAGIPTYNAGGAAALTVTEPQPIDDAAAYARAVARDLNSDSPRLAMQISHPDINTPVRIVADNVDHTIGTDIYTAVAFRGSPPQIREGEAPRASFEIDNVGRELLQWVEATGGGRGASIRVMLVHFDPVIDASVIAWELPALSVGTAQISNETVSFDLVFRSGRSRPGLKFRATPTVSPGLF